MVSGFFLASGVLSGVLATQQSDGRGLTNADLRLVATANTQLMVGEFLAVRTTVTARHRVRLCDRDVSIEVDAGHGFTEHVEAYEGWEDVLGGNELAPGRSFVATSAVGLEALDPPAGLDGLASLHASARFVFDRPGVYRIRSRVGDAVSNVIVVVAVMPNGDDTRLLMALRERPAVLGAPGVVDDGLRAEGERFLAEFGPRPLLQPFVRRLHGGTAGESR